MNNALLKDNLAARAVDSQTRKVFSRSGLIAGLCLSSLVSSYAIPGGVDATKAKNESVMITQQAKRVSGVVTDSAGEPIPGANVVQKETTNGTVTDMNGKYTLDVPNNATLVISFIGYTTKEIKVGSQSVLNVSLVEEAIGLNEVVAIGYGYVKKKDLTGAVSTVSADDMVLGGTVSNAAQALQGKTAGVQVSQSSKAPGGTIAVRVRGNNSISSTNEPLYVVDGFPSSEGLNLNPNDIGIMGSSAGGHLASTIATHAPEALRPNFQILFYPVITMDKSFTHMGSHDNLLGKDASADLEKEFSNEKQVTKETPRAFIVYSDDDKVVPPANGVNYYLALNKKGVPSVLHIYHSP